MNYIDRNLFKFLWEGVDASLQTGFLRKLLHLNMREKAAAVLNCGQKVVPENLAFFIKDISNPKTLEKYGALLADKGITFKEFQDYMHCVARGIMAAHMRLKHEIPYIYFNDKNEFKPAGQSGPASIHIGVEIFIDRFIALQTSAYSSAHLSGIPGDIYMSGYYTGFEESVHAEQYQIDPNIGKRPVVVKEYRTDPQKVMHHYYTDLVEVYAGMLIREEARRLNPQNASIQKRTWELDLFVIQLYKEGKLAAVPDYMQKLFNDREAEFGQKEKVFSSTVSAKPPQHWYGVGLNENGLSPEDERDLSNAFRNLVEGRRNDSPEKKPRRPPAAGEPWIR